MQQPTELKASLEATKTDNSEKKIGKIVNEISTTEATYYERLKLLNENYVTALQGVVEMANKEQNNNTADMQKPTTAIQTSAMHLGRHIKDGFNLLCQLSLRITAILQTINTTAISNNISMQDTELTTTPNIPKTIGNNEKAQIIAQFYIDNSKDLCLAFTKYIKNFQSISTFYKELNDLIRDNEIYKCLLSFIEDQYKQIHVLNHALEQDDKQFSKCLIIPTQRIMAYGLFMKELLDNVEKNTITYATIELALAHIKYVSLSMNTVQQEFIEKKKISQEERANQIKEAVTNISAKENALTELKALANTSSFCGISSINTHRRANALTNKSPLAEFMPLITSSTDTVIQKDVSIEPEKTIDRQEFIKRRRAVTITPAFGIHVSMVSNNTIIFATDTSNTDANTSAARSAPPPRPFPVQNATQLPAHPLSNNAANNDLPIGHARKKSNSVGSIPINQNNIATTALQLTTSSDLLPVDGVTKSLTANLSPSNTPLKKQ